MDAFSSYFAMGGYAGYVWPAYVLTAAVIIGLLLASWRGLKARERELKILQDLSPGRRGRSRDGSEAQG
ncbi:MAG TPA: heme exporter protein CcmD [Candidatus Sulfotelmatobacter sp.]|jgi:heme exporter protein D|nr:heme exporter protein CcmD [Candidatus Sulfotelmatobacter sp.]